MCLLAGRRGERDHREVRYSIGRVLDEPGDAVVPFDALGIEHNARGRDRRSRPCFLRVLPRRGRAGSAHRLGSRGGGRGSRRRGFVSVGEGDVTSVGGGSVGDVVFEIDPPCRSPSSMQKTIAFSGGIQIQAHDVDQLLLKARVA